MIIRRTPYTLQKDAGVGLFYISAGHEKSAENRCGGRVPDRLRRRKDNHEKKFGYKKQ